MRGGKGQPYLLEHDLVDWESITYAYAVCCASSANSQTLVPSYRVVRPIDSQNSVRRSRENVMQMNRSFRSFTTAEFVPSLPASTYLPLAATPDVRV